LPSLHPPDQSQRLSIISTDGPIVNVETATIWRRVRNVYGHGRCRIRCSITCLDSWNL
jgi:hypothetical protein